MPIDATHQLPFIPESFANLYRGQRGKLLVLVEEMRERYELCEDLAQQIMPAAQALHHDDGVSQDEVLLRFEQVLASPEAGLRADEAAWVARRLAELLHWAG